MKRRKVNKKELIDGNVGMIFEKTFAHREQMVGELDKKEEDEKWFQKRSHYIYKMNFFNKYKNLFDVPDVLNS